MAKVFVNFVEKMMLNSKENVLFPMRKLIFRQLNIASFPKLAWIIFDI